MIRITLGFWSEAMQTRREWSEIVTTLREKKIHQLNNLHPGKLFFKNESRIKTSPDKPKLREFNDRRPAVHNMLKEFPQRGG